MGRRGNPYDNARTESFMKTLKVEGVYPMAYETFEDVTTEYCQAIGMTAALE
jgi:putative transposase